MSPAFPQLLQKHGWSCRPDAPVLSDYAFPYIILVLSLVTLAVYMSASEIQVKTHTHTLPTADRQRQDCLKEAVRVK